MTMTAMRTKTISLKDTFVKVLATVFLNPADRDHQGKKVFIQDFLGCGCPDEVVEQASISFFSRPLGMHIEQRIAQLEASRASTSFEQDVNRFVNLPKALKWPRRASGELISPCLWRRPMLEAIEKAPENLEKLIRLRTMSNATIDAVIEVPGRAFFFLVAQGKRRLNKNTLLVQYDSGQLLYKLMGYNRCRLFTITEEDKPKIIPQIDTALTWHGLYNSFFQMRDRYAFSRLVLDPFA